MMQSGPIPAEDMISIIQSFPSRVKAMASRLSEHNDGPFPLDHDDFLHSNIMVDKSTLMSRAPSIGKGHVEYPGS